MKPAELLAEILGRALSGDLDSVAIAMVYKDGASSHATSDSGFATTLLGAATVLLHDLTVHVAGLADSEDEDEGPPPGAPIGSTERH